MSRSVHPGHRRSNFAKPAHVGLHHGQKKWHGSGEVFAVGGGPVVRVAEYAGLQDASALAVVDNMRVYQGSVRQFGAPRFTGTIQPAANIEEVA